MISGAGGGPTGLMLPGVDVAIVGRRDSPELIGLRAGGLHSCTIAVLDQRGIADRFPVRYRKTLSLCSQLLLGDQALHESGSFLLIRFDPFIQQHLADLRDVALLVLSHSFNVALQLGVNSKS